MRFSRLWLALVLVAFCLPLFAGLGRADLETDEAIYSFAVDRILEVGNWLEPGSSPSETAVFLEKPPLKFWMVAAPIKAGLLPHNEFGLRFVDALAGGVAFAYVFAIGSLLAGPVCGAVAVLLLFIHWPLLFTHGLRTNNMEASLVLSYCAGVFHFLRWSALDDERSRRRHIVGASLFFVVGFMTKFVAALFLPFTLGIVALASSRCRARLIQDRRAWFGAAALVVALSAPWFIYAQVRFGSLLWETILGEHVLRRMTGYLDPTHVHPWHYYLNAMWQEFANQRVQWLVAAGFITLLVQAVRRRWLEGTVVLMWAIIPLAIISAGTSKLYHYAYPYLPPLAIAGGYVVSLVVMLAPAPLRRLLEGVEDAISRVWPGFEERTRSGSLRLVSSVLIAIAAAASVATAALGGLRIHIDGQTVLSNSGVLRPVLLIAVLALATRTSARVGRILVALLVVNTMPLAAYRQQLEALPEGTHPIRTTAECLQRMQRESSTAAGVFVDIPEGIWHPLYYYFRRVQPLELAKTPFDPAIDRYLSDPASPRPVLISDVTWREYLERKRGSAPGSVASALSPPMVSFLNTVLILPGPYVACSSEAALRAPR